ncbi:DUF6356 family protein [Novosphingobium sp.]|uniref:DUF6356 family protein n=1 Tax=Novosphingobium sp. TaxID=1874826 RepID=UPI0035AF74C9
MSLTKLFTEHPASVDESYGEHLAMATGFGLRMILGGIACLIHGLLPFLFVKTGSRQIGALHDIMVVNRNRKQARVQMPAVLDFVI